MLYLLIAALTALFNHGQRSAVDGTDFEDEWIETLDAPEVDSVTIFCVLAVADVRKNSARLAEVVA